MDRAAAVVPKACPCPIGMGRETACCPYPYPYPHRHISYRLLCRARDFRQRMDV